VTRELALVKTGKRGNVTRQVPHIAFIRFGLAIPLYDNIVDSLYTINQRQAKINTTIGILRYHLNYVSFDDFPCQREGNDLKYPKSESIEKKSTQLENWNKR